MQTPIDPHELPFNLQEFHFKTKTRQANVEYGEIFWIEALGPGLAHQKRKRARRGDTGKEDRAGGVGRGVE